MLVGTFIEEVVSPIPSFLVLVPAGAATQAQGSGVWYLLVLAVLSGVGRIVGAVLQYWVADKSEDLLLAKKRRLFGLRHADIERLGARLGGKRDWWVLFTVNAVPIFPIALLALACGFLKVRFWLFVTATFFGTIINAVIYLLIGYGGVQAAGALRNLELASQIMLIIVVVLVVWAAIYYWRKRRITVS